MHELNQIFGVSPNIGWQQECARAALVLAYGLAVVRIVGRRVFGKWTALDIVVSIMVGSNLSRALTGNAQLFGTLAATTWLMVRHWALSRASAESKLLSRILEGSPVKLGSGEAPDRRALRRHSVSEADLAEALRQAGVEDPSTARVITLEPSGKITVLKYS
jgi:uncharacterized membrane protein YcaP (DUF421 family)